MTKSLNLAKAMAKLEKGKASRNVKLAEKEISKFIDGQIKVKKEEIEELKIMTDETSEENNEDLKDLLLTNLENKSINNISKRKNSAKEYCLEALGKMKENSQYKADQDVKVKKLEKQIESLKELRKELEIIDVEVETED